MVGLIQNHKSFDSLNLYSILTTVTVGSNVNLGDGCPTNLGYQGTADVTSDTQTAAVSCCSIDGTDCVRTDCSLMTFTVARQFCIDIGRRICTPQELLDELCCEVGCGHDARLNWQVSGK